MSCDIENERHVFDFDAGNKCDYWLVNRTLIFDVSYLIALVAIVSFLMCSGFRASIPFIQFSVRNKARFNLIFFFALLCRTSCVQFFFPFKYLKQYVMIACKYVPIIWIRLLECCRFANSGFQVKRNKYLRNPFKEIRMRKGKKKKKHYNRDDNGSWKMAHNENVLCQKKRSSKIGITSNQPK